MKKTMKALLFALLMLTLVVMTMICVSAAADGDTASVEGFNEANYNFKVTDANGANAAYYINLGSTRQGTAGGAWAAVPEGGTITQLKDVTCSSRVYLYSSKSFTFEGNGFSFFGWVDVRNSVDDDADKNLVNHTIIIQNVKIDGGSNCPLAFYTHGATFKFSGTTVNSSGWATVLRANFAIYEFGDNNNFCSNNSVFEIKNASTLKFDGAKSVYDVCRRANLFHVVLIDKNDKGVITRDDRVPNVWEVNIEIKNGTFKHSQLAESGANGYLDSIFGFYNTGAKSKVTITGGTFDSEGTSVFAILPTDIVQIDISGGTFDLVNSDGSLAIFHFITNGSTKTEAQEIDGVPTMTSINVTGGTFRMRRTSMPIIYAYAKYNGTQEMPVSITWNGANTTLASHGRLMVLRSGGYYNVSIENDINFENSSYYVVEAEEGAMVNVTFENCTVLKCAGLAMATNKDMKSTLHVTVNGGSYSSADVLLNVAYAQAYSATLKGDFTIANVNGFANDYANVTIDASSTLAILFADKDTTFDNVPSVFKNKGVSVTYNFTIDKNYSLENISLQKLHEKRANEGGSFSEYTFVNVVGYSFHVKGGATFTLTGGTYTGITAETFITIYNGTVILSGVTLDNNGYKGNIFRGVTPKQGDEIARITLTDCTIDVWGGNVLYAQGGTNVEISVTSNNIVSKLTTHDKQHVFRSGSKTTNFRVYLNNVTCESGYNIISLSPSDTASIEFINATIKTPNSYAIYGASWGTYIFRGGKYECKNQLLYFAPQNDMPEGQQPFKFYNLQFSGEGLFRFSTSNDVSDAVVPLDVKNMYADRITGSAFITLPGSTLNLNISDSMFVVNATNNPFVLANNIYGEAKEVNISTVRTYVLFNSVVGVLYKDMVVTEYAPTVKFGTASYYLFMSADGTYDCDRGVQLYLGDDQANSGIRFVTMLSADLVALAKAAVDAGKTVTYGTLIAPTDYVVKAKAFTKSAIDDAMGSTNGILGNGLNTYIDKVADKSLRDRDGDRVFESFSVVLMNLKSGNYNRSFSTIAYVIIDGNTYYSTYNTFDDARTAKQMAVVLNNNAFLATLTDEEKAVLNAYLSAQ